MKIDVRVLIADSFPIQATFRRGGQATSGEADLIGEKGQVLQAEKNSKLE